MIRCKKCKKKVVQIHYHSRKLNNESSNPEKNPMSKQIGFICLNCNSVFLFKQFKKLVIEEQHWNDIKQWVKS